MNCLGASSDEPRKPGDGRVPFLQAIKKDYTFFARGDLDS